MAKKKHVRSSQKSTQKNVCNCTNLVKTGIYRPKSYKSFNRYVDIDDNSTRVLHKSNVTKNRDAQSSNKNVSYPILQKLKSQKNKKSGNKSIVSLYRKHRKNRLRNEEKNMHSTPELISMILQEPQLNPITYQFGTGDVCAGGPCRKPEFQESSIAQSNKNAKYLVKTNKQRHMCKCKMLGKEEENPKMKLQQYDNNINAKKNKMSLKARIFSKGKVSDTVDTVLKNSNKNKKQNTEQLTKSTKHKNECQCSILDKQEDDVMTSPKQAEKNKKSLKEKICECKAEDKIDKIPKNTRIQQIMINKQIRGVGVGDQNLDKTTPNTQILNHSCECKLDNIRNLRTVNAGDQTGEPFFEMKVDKQNMHVLNASEIKYKVKSLGRLQSRRPCICPTHRGVCERGVCEKAMKNKQTNFDCKCITKNGVIECTDKTCDSKKIFKRMKIGKVFRSTSERKPLFEVKLDPGNMNIINTTEIEDIFEKSNHGVCPTGICSKRAKNNNQLNCKCINKKIIPRTMECTEKTCYPVKKCNLSQLSSKMFSGCETWAGAYKKMINSRYTRRYESNVNKEKKAKSRPEIHRRNGLKIKISKDRNKKHRGSQPLRTMRTDLHN